MQKLPMFLLLGATIALAGCGNDKSSWDYDPDDYDPATILEYSISGFDSDKTGSMLLSHLDPDLSNVKTNTVTIESSNVSNTSEKAKSSDTTSDFRRGCSILQEGTAQILKHAKAKKAKGLSPSSKAINTVYTDTKAGESIDVYCYYTTDKISVRKMSDTTTDTLVFAEEVDGSPVITAAQAESIDEYFGTKNPYDAEGMGIGPRVRSIFGNEWRKDGGRDGTEKVVIIVLSSAHSGGNYGFMLPRDAEDSADDSRSNMGEIIYINSEYISGDSYDLYSTVAHEFQHMCDLNQKVVHDGDFDGEREYTVINEGKSVIAEELAGFGWNSTGGANFYLYRSASAYLKAPEEFPFGDFSNSNGDYGKAYLYMRYITDRFGQDTLTKIATSTGVGYDNIATQTGVAFDVSFQDWGITNILDPMKDAPTKFIYKDLDLNHEYLVRGDNGDAATTKLLAPVTTASATSKMQVTMSKPYVHYYFGYKGVSDGKLTVDITDPTHGTPSQFVVSKDGTYEQTLSPVEQ